ncbi:MAG: hypothetical protein Crog4KO_03370 [Crocinitomicaceae bacterium]
MKTTKTKIYLLCGLILFTFCNYSLSQNWGSLNSGINDNVNDLKFLDETSGLAVGDGGRIIGTLDYGGSWNLIPSGTVENLRALESPDVGIWVSCGDNGTILRSTNSGLTWSPITSGVNENLVAVDFLDANNGMISGALGTILTTTDGGLNWTIQNSTTTNNLNGNSYTPSGDMFVVGDGLTGPTILVSYNNGVNWSSQTSSSLNSLNDVDFTNDLNGFAVGDLGTLLTTDDGGTSWVTSVVSSENLSTITFINDSVGFISGDGGTILKTEDYGVTWNALTSNSVENLNSIDMISPLSGYAAGDNGEILRTCPTPLFSISTSDSVCQGTTVDFTNESSAAESYLWIVDGDTVASSVNLSYNFSEAGSIDVSLIATNTACENETLQNFTVTAAPSVNLGNDTTICSSCSDTLIAPSGAGYSYQWYYNGSFNGNVSDMNIAASAGEYVVEVTNAEGCVGSDTINIMMTNSLSELTSQSIDVIVYPNPSTGVFLLDKNNFDGAVEYVITTALGVQVQRGMIDSIDSKIDLSTEPAGVYYLMLITDEMEAKAVLTKR